MSQLQFGNKVVQVNLNLPKIESALMRGKSCVFRIYPDWAGRVRARIWWDKGWFYEIWWERTGLKQERVSSLREAFRRVLTWSPEGKDCPFWGPYVVK